MTEIIMQSSNPFITNAPRTTTIKDLRSVQTDVLNTLWQLFPSSKRFKIIAPVGAGKSVIALSIAKYASKLELHTLISSPLNELVNQYDSSFSEIGLFTLKGRRNYPCMAGRKHAGVGYCRYDECSQGLEARECRKQNPPQECYVCKCNRCVYPPLIKRFRGSEIANTNFSMFLLGITNNPDVIILDEADMSEDFIRMHYAVTLDSNYDKDFLTAIQQLEDYYKALQEEINLYKTANIKKETVEELEEKLGKITYLLDDYQTNHEKWAITTYINRKGQSKTKFEPVTTSRFIEPLLENKIIILMSATLPKEGQEVAIEVDSPFPVEVRPWIYKPFGRMSKKYRDKTIPKVALFLSKLEGKTLVHCQSYATAEKIQLALLELGIHPLLQTNNYDEILDEDVVKRETAVKEFKEDDDINKILLSVKLDRGVDFSEPEIVNNVIAVLGFPNPVEPLTKAKNEMLGESWQIPHIIADIEQKMGRIHRNDKLGIINGRPAVKLTTIVDSSFGWFYQEHKSKFHKWFTEAQVHENPRLKKAVVEVN